MYISGIIEVPAAVYKEILDQKLMYCSAVINFVIQEPTLQYSKITYVHFLYKVVTLVAYPVKRK